MEYVRILTEPCTTLPPLVQTFSYELDNFQKHAVCCIHANEHVLITAHTGSGKTMPAEYAIIYTITQLKKRVIYTAPIKTLSNQKYNDWKKYENLFSVGLMTGDNKINPDADLVIMTTEILCNALYNIDTSTSYFEEGFIEKLGCVVFDEVHYINDKDRGHVWEETLIMLPSYVLLIMLSATIDQPEQFAAWIAGNKKQRVNLIPTSHRVVPLTHYIYSSHQLYQVLDNNNVFNEQQFVESKQSYDDGKMKLQLINEAVIFLKENNLLQTIFFVFSRANCEKFASMITTKLIDSDELFEINKLWSNKLGRYESQYATSAQYQEVKKAVMKGVAWHHSGLLPILKEIIEIIFQHGLIKVLFATETFAVGVNMPTRTVVFTDLTKFTEAGERLLTTAEYRQMAGRAGRRGLDTQGVVILLPLHTHPSRSELITVMTGNIPSVTSKFDISSCFMLKIIQSSQKLTEFIDRSMFKQELDATNAAKLLELEKFVVQEVNCSGLVADCLEFDLKESKLLQRGIILNKKQIKEKQRLWRELNDAGLVKTFEEQKLIQEQNSKREQLAQNITGLNEHVTLVCASHVKFLYDAQYISCIKPAGELTASDVTPKGVLAALMNECNPFIIAEMIVQYKFTSLSSAEIVALLAIFVEEEDIAHEVVVNEIAWVHELIELYRDTEHNCGVRSTDEFWKISTGFVDAAYIWASGGGLQDVFNVITIYEGNFIRNMLKLSNIAKNTADLCKIYGYVEVLPAFEQIKQLIERDIVNVQSLYLGI